MKLIIARHGDAINVGENGIKRDVDRPLSALGQSQIKSMASYLKQNNIRVDLIISSPYLRTLQTTDIYAKELDIKTIKQSDLMQSGTKIEHIESLFSEYNLWDDYINKTVFLVGHAPDVGRICDYYISTKGFFFNPGNIALINFPIPGSLGQLIGFWTPDLLKQ